jgi:hypothetical protein
MQSTFLVALKYNQESALHFSEFRVYFLHR